MDQPTIIDAIRQSPNFQAELRYLARGGYEVASEPRLFKHLEHDLVRVVFPTTATEITEGTVVGLVTLYDRRERYNVYAHTLCAGPGVNILLKAFDQPMPPALPQPAPDGQRAIRQFVAWKQAAWTQFLTEELDLGAEEASRLWIARFWKALDRMFGGGHLLGFSPEDELANARAAY